MKAVAIAGLTPETYRRHPLHREENAWPETNCYADLWIEVLHSLRLDPIPALSVCLMVDWEGDQWTFFKPSPDDLRCLYGIDVQELNLWNEVEPHLAAQVCRGRLPLVEVDSFFLPDTAGIAYRTDHTKTTIAINEIDTEQRYLAYFHNSGYYTLNGEDYTGIFAPGSLPPYTEFAKCDRLLGLPNRELIARSRSIARRWLAFAPAHNPFLAFGNGFGDALERLLSHPVPYYHRYAFAIFRQFGAAFHLSAAYLRWLDAEPTPGLADAADRFQRLSDGARTLLLKTARAVHTRKAFAFEPLIAAMADDWEQGFDHLHLALGPRE